MLGSKPRCISQSTKVQGLYIYGMPLASRPDDTINRIVCIVRSSSPSHIAYWQSPGVIHNTRSDMAVPTSLSNMIYIFLGLKPRCIFQSVESQACAYCNMRYARPDDIYRPRYIKFEVWPE